MGRKVTAYEAKDGSLHLDESNAQRRDIEILDQNVLELFDSVANSLSRDAISEKPKSAHTPERYKAMLAVLFSNHAGSVEKILELIEERKDLKNEVGDSEDDSDEDDDDDSEDDDEEEEED